MCREKEVGALAEGNVKWFNEKKGYGFIQQEDGRDLFVHFSSITMSGFKTLNEGDRVAFEVEETDRGPRRRTFASSESPFLPPNDRTGRLRGPGMPFVFPSSLRTGLGGPA